MVGIDLQTYAIFVFEAYAAVASDAANRFGKHCRGTTMQNSKRLLGSMVYRHTCHDILRANFCKNDVEVFPHVPLAKLVQVFECNGFWNHISRHKSNKRTEKLLL